MAKERKKLSKIKLEGYQPLREIVFDVLREAIMSGQLPPGERLMEVQLAEELGVSRTPIRESIRKLELEGFVVVGDRKGAFVSNLSIKDIINVFEIRQALEVLVARLAAERISDDEIESLERLLVELSETLHTDDTEKWVQVDSEFHDIMYKATRNERLEQMINNIFEQINRYRIMCSADPYIRKSSYDEHRRIIEAVADRDEEKAQQAAREHIENTQKFLLEIFKEELSEQD